ncbi:hypothetical protein [Anoxybacillus ayderensis]|uniref:hypothetical protein n=1 Tax=Anoxybacillus ayderensis TaxID=265546 RepID=UPI002E22E3FC|nr:hypothetical protein [Anoxybacillus ayderensis]
MIDAQNNNKQAFLFLFHYFSLLRCKMSTSSFFIATATSIAAATMVILPFSMKQEPLCIAKRFADTIGEYPYSSANSFNFYSLIGANYVPNLSPLFLLSYHTWGIVFIVMITAFS